MKYRHAVVKQNLPASKPEAKEAKLPGITLESLGVFSEPSLDCCPPKALSQGPDEDSAIEVDKLLVEDLDHAREHDMEEEEAEEREADSECSEDEDSDEDEECEKDFPEALDKSCGKARWPSLFLSTLLKMFLLQSSTSSSSNSARNEALQEEHDRNHFTCDDFGHASEPFLEEVLNIYYSHGTTKRPHDLRKLTALARKGNFNVTEIVTGLIYCERLAKTSPEFFCQHCPLDIFLVSTITANKYLYDEDSNESTDNKQVRELFKLGKRKLQDLELHFLLSLNFSCYVAQTEFELFSTDLHKRVLRRMLRSPRVQPDLPFETVVGLLDFSQLSREVLVPFTMNFGAMTAAYMAFAFSVCATVTLVAPVPMNNSKLIVSSHHLNATEDLSLTPSLDRSHAIVPVLARMTNSSLSHVSTSMESLKLVSSGVNVLLLYNHPHNFSSLPSYSYSNHALFRNADE